MKKKFFSFCFFFAAAGFLSALDWPVKQLEILSTFGSREGDHFSIGTELSSPDGTVRAADSGTLLYYWDENHSQESLPSGLGDFLVLQHENGLKTLYAHLKKGSIDERKTSISGKDAVGIIGDTGWTYGKLLKFIIFDTDFNQIVNPMLVLPSVTDTRKPVIRDISLRSDRDETILKNDISIPAEDYEIIGEIYDLSEFSKIWTPMAPYGITMFINGVEVKKITFEALQLEDGNVVLRTSGGMTSREFYIDDRHINIGTFMLVPGQTRLEMIVIDFAGNESAKSFTFEVTGS